VIEATIDEALDRAEARSEQRAQIYRVRNRAIAAIDDYLKVADVALCPLVEAVLREQIQRHFVSGPIDAASLDAQALSDHQQVVEAIAQSVQEVHAVLTPPQTLVIAGYVRATLGDRSVVGLGDATTNRHSAASGRDTAISAPGNQHRSANGTARPSTARPGKANPASGVTPWQGQIGTAPTAPGP
jgi:hypothetical protein